MQFRYFLEPEKFAYILEDEQECDICGKESRCFDGSLFLGEEEYNAFCLDCVAKGKILDVGAFAVDPDLTALTEQLKKKNPGVSDKKIEKRAEELTQQLEGTTPKFPTWQDWLWPAHCGDYCQLLRLAGQEDYNRQATDGKGIELFRRTLYGHLKDMTNVDEIWAALKPGSIKGITDSQDNWSPMAYMFKCLTCGEIVTVWDCD